jgi:hypothetical protein
MTSSYSGNPASGGIDHIRYLIGDTGPEFILTDDEIEFELDNRDTTLHAALASVNAIVAKLTKNYEQRFETIFEKPQEAVHSYRLLASRLEKQIKKSEIGFGPPSAGGIRKTDVFTTDKDDNRVPPTFDRDQFAIGKRDQWPSV